MSMELVIRVLGDETRYKIFQLLLDNEYCVGGLAKALKISDSAVSQHLKVLKEADVVVGRKVGYYTHHKVNKKTMTKFLTQFKEVIK